MKRSRHSRSRKGTSLATTIVCLFFAALIITAVTYSINIHRTQQRRAPWRQQVAWLADSAVQRAIAQLANDSSYDGETWNVEWTDALQHRIVGRAEIQVESTGATSDGKTPQTTIRVHAVLTPGQFDSLQCRREHHFAPAEPGNVEDENVQ